MQAGGADLLADAAAHAVLRDPQQVLPGVRGQLAHPVQEFLMGGPVLRGGRRDPPPADPDVPLDGGQLAVDLLVQLFLLLHVKGGQPVVHHLDHVDVGGLDAALPAEPGRQLSRTPVPVAVGEHHVKMPGAEIRFVQKFLHHGRHLMAVDRGHHPDGLRLEGQLPAGHHLRDADRVRLQLSGDVQAVACAGKIKDHFSFVLLWLSCGTGPFLLYSGCNNRLLGPIIDSGCYNRSRGFRQKNLKLL